MDEAQALLIVLASAVAAILLLRFFLLIGEGRKHVAELEAKRMDRLRTKAPDQLANSGF